MRKLSKKLWTLRGKRGKVGDSEAGEGASGVADVFISYHEKSAGELAEQIANALENAGISSWCARRDLPFGGNFAREIPAQIDARKVFLLFVTESADTWHIESEVRLAFERLNRGEDITILPLEIGNFERKPFIYLLNQFAKR